VEIREKIRTDLKLPEFRRNAFILFFGKTLLGNREHDVVFFTNVGTNQLGEPPRKVRKFHASFCAQGVFETFDQ